jgi:hypothetical protein
MKLLLVEASTEHDKTILAAAVTPIAPTYSVVETENLLSSPLNELQQVLCSRRTANYLGVHAFPVAPGAGDIPSPPRKPTELFDMDQRTMF